VSGLRRRRRHLARAARFVGRHWVRIAVMSAVLLVPCFWHRRIHAGDLGSHVYNAWLAQLVTRGEAPGLSVTSRWDNVLFDLALSWLVAIVGFGAGEKIAVSLAVMVVFWGAFAFVASVTGRAPWLLTPGLGMVTYGWTFHAGFFNYYLSIGLSLFALALFWRGTGWERLLAIAVGAPLICLAHSLGLVWFAASAAYIAVAERVAPRRRVLGTLLSAVLIVAAAAYLRARYRTMGAFGPAVLFTGADQVFLFGRRYLWIVVAVLLFGVAVVAADAIGRRGRLAARYAVPIQLYGLTLLGALLFPSVIFLPGHPAPAALLVERLTLVCAVLACAILGAARPRRWHAITIAAIAVAFAALVYRDTARIDDLEAQAHRLVAALPPRSRVLATIAGPYGSRIWVRHLAARACVGRCFAYGNYEAASGHFRVRASPGNPIVLTDIADVFAAESGSYVLRPNDLPAYQLYQCGQASVLCIGELSAGFPNSAVGARR
jgi:hypothetical protein